MPPSGHVGKKVGGSNRQRSRNTTPQSVSAANAAAAAAAAAVATPPTPTAALPEITTAELEHLELRFEVFRNLTYDDLVDPGVSAGSSAVPDYKAIEGIVARLKRLQGIADDRGSSYDRGMRLLSQNRRLRMDEAAVERSREEGRLQREANDEHEHQRRANKKKRKATPGDGGSATAASSQAVTLSQSQDPMDVDDKVEIKDKGGSSSGGGSAATAAADFEKNEDGSEDDDESDESDDSGAPPPRPVPQHQTFGEDPSTFPDPTVYEIRAVTPSMSVDEIKAIYSVAVYPKTDLSDLIAGEAPDRDLSNAKPSNQINFSTFSTYIEPYFRPFTEEDLAFLRERGDRVTPFLMPRRGTKHYSEIWAEEDGAMALDPPLSSSAAATAASAVGASSQRTPNQPRGTIENMNDDIAETDKLSVGPLLSRLLSAMRPEHRPVVSVGENGVVDGSTNGGGGGNDSFLDGGGGGGSGSVDGGGNGGNDNRTLPPAAFMPESSSEAWKKTSQLRLDYNQIEERIKQELRHIGFLPFPNAPGVHGAGAGNSSANSASTAANGTSGVLGTAGPNGTATTNATGNSSTNGTVHGTTNVTGSGAGSVPNGPEADYDGHYDDEVAARLRQLQAALRQQVLTNGARKARLAELVKERMAFQEYQTILEDLDGQVQGAYLKRTRTLGKPKKGKRPGGGGAGSTGSATTAAGGMAAGLARPGIGDVARTLMERRRRWIDNLGTVFDDEQLRKVLRASDPNSTIFPEAEMKALLKREKEAWDDEVEEE